MNLSDPFLERVKRAYRASLDVGNDHGGVIWRDINAKKGEIHAALMADGNEDLRQIFADPGATNLYDGIDPLRCNFTETAEFEELAQLMPRGSISSFYARQALYQASLIKGFNPESVVEIGPGIGRTAATCYRLGIIDYTTIDLPMGMVAQACFLGSTLGPEHIVLPGDPVSATGIKLYVAGYYPDRVYDLAFNADSLTEMSFRAANDYMKWLQFHCDIFIAIAKHNNLFTLRDISSKYFVRNAEQPYPMRPGYTQYVLRHKIWPGFLPWHRFLWHIVKLVAHRGPKAVIGFAGRRIRNDSGAGTGGFKTRAQSASCPSSPVRP